MDSRIPSAPYPFERLGGKIPDFEVGQHTAVVRRLELVRVQSGASGSECAVDLWMSVPDSRLMASLSIVFEPDVAAGLGELDSTIHLAATDDVGFGSAPVEDLRGTASVPVRLVAAGLRGFVYSPSEEVVGMQADLMLRGPASTEGNNGAGRWFALARWQALRPMTEIEWRKALAEMVLLPTPSGIQTIGLYAPG